MYAEATLAYGSLVIFLLCWFLLARGAKRTNKSFETHGLHKPIGFTVRRMAVCLSGLPYLF
jgi:hypothetical protein